VLYRDKKHRECALEVIEYIGKQNPWLSMRFEGIKRAALREHKDSLYLKPNSYLNHV
jgi:hypothetical protein